MKWILFVFTLGADGHWVTEQHSDHVTESLCHQVAEEQKFEQYVCQQPGVEVPIWRTE